MCKGPEVGLRLTNSWKRKEKSVWLEHRRSRAGHEKARDTGKAQVTGTIETGVKIWFLLFRT